MLTIGLTGGIASGKTTVCERFAARGVAVIDADEAARQVVRPGEPALEELVAAFGPGILDDKGALDRAALRQQAFAEPDTRERLEAILHPRIREWMDAQYAGLDAPYAIEAIPLLVENGLDVHVDRVLVVDVPESVQRQRLRERDGSSEAQINAILAAQCSREERLRHADDVIDNTADPAALDAQVARLHENYLALAESRGGPTSSTGARAE